MARTWRRLRSPSARWSVAALVGVGIVLSAIAVIGTQVMVHVTGTDAFCGAACHSMQWVAQEHRESTHGATRTGMRATCHDCHIPREYPELLWYKAVAGTKDVIGEMRGIIYYGREVPGRAQAHGGAGVVRIQGQRFARLSRLPRVLHRGAREAAGSGARPSTRRCSRAARPASTATKGSATWRPDRSASESSWTDASLVPGRHFE